MRKRLWDLAKSRIEIPPPVFIPVGRRVPNTKWSPASARNKCTCPFQPAESFLARARAPPAAQSDSVDVRARRPSPLLPAGPFSATPPALRLLPCAPLDVGRKDRFPLGTRLREDRARVVNAARARSPFPGTPVAVAWDPRLKSAQQRAAPPPAAAPLTETNSVPPFSPPPPPPPPRASAPRARVASGDARSILDLGHAPLVV